MNSTLVRAPRSLIADPAPVPASREERRRRRGSAERIAVGTLAAAFFFQALVRPSGPGNSSPVDVLTIGTLVTAALWASTSGRKLRAPYALGVALMLVAGAASGLVGPLPGTALLFVMQDILLFGWCTAVANVAAMPGAMRKVLVAWSWGAVVAAAVCVAAYLGHITAIEGLTAADGNRVLFTFGDPNYAALFWVMSLFVVYASRAPHARRFRWPGYGLLLWSLFLTESNGGGLELLIGIVCVLAIRSYRRRGPTAAIATILILVVLAAGGLKAFPLSKARQWAANSHISLLVNSVGRSKNSSAQRGTIIHETLQMYESGNMLLGSGPNSTKQLLITESYPYAKMAHDDYLAALIERGPLGLLGLLLLIGCIARRTWSVITRPLSPQFAAAVPRPAGLVAAMMASGVAAFYYQILHFRFLWALFALMAVLATETQ